MSQHTPATAARSGYPVVVLAAVVTDVPIANAADTPWHRRCEDKGDTTNRSTRDRRNEGDCE